MRVALPFGVSTPEEKRDPYRKALAAVGIEPVEGVVTLAGLAGLCLAGGADVDPALYGAPRHPRTEEPDRDRDRIETALLREALDRDLPVLAICRGLQLFNVALGGALTQHIEGHNQRKLRDAHPIAIVSGSRLEAILETTDYVVNSRHHQCAGRVARGLLVAATAPDGVVEALELPGKRFVLAVQWHPEARIDGPDAALFRAFRDSLDQGR
ncbi:MAG: gamma-glutamyl-gamma-aminobutyrate hydrolase family protein [Bryobacteraceae bacterium]